MVVIRLNHALRARTKVYQLKGDVTPGRRQADAANGMNVS
jgi:hypothetical protein